MRDHLHRLPEIDPRTLIGQHAFIDLTGREIVETGKITTREAFVVTKVQISFRPIIKDIDLAVLKGTHRAGVDVQIRIEFLQDHLQSATLQKRAQGSRRQSLAQ